MHALRPLLFAFLFVTTGCTWRPSRHSLAGNLWHRPARPTARPFTSRALAPTLPQSAAQSLLTRRIPAVAPTTCPRVETSPGRWAAPLCAPLPAVDVHRFIAGRRFSGRTEPTAVDLRQQNLVGPIRDQQQVSVCWAFATASVIDNAIRRSGDAVSSVSPMHIVATTHFSDIVLGRDDHKPVTIDQTWPYDPRKACAFDDDRMGTCRQAYGVVPNSWRRNPTLVTELAHADGAHRYRLRRARHLEAQPANIPQLSQTLAEGTAILAVLAIDHQAWGWRAVSDGLIDDYTTHDRVGHAVALVGYRTTPTGKQFLIKNSWGHAWAHDGYAWIPATTLAQNLLRAMVITVSPTNPVPPQRRPLPNLCDLLPIGGLCTPATTQAPPLTWHQPM